MAQPVEYKFTSDWFSHNIPAWVDIFEELQPKRVLEVGSYEGRSTVWMAAEMGKHEGGLIECVDVWDDKEVRGRFDFNITLSRKENPSVKFGVCSDLSSNTLGRMRMEEYPYDLAYVDGSHKASDVLSDAVDAFHLCRSGGIIIFDDYYGGLLKEDPRDFPRMAIDSFVSCFARELEILSVTNQMVVKKK